MSTGKRDGYRWWHGAWRPSAAQRRVLDEVAHGDSNATIARTLGISIETVRWHMRTLLSETGAADRVELGNWWSERSEGAAYSLAA